MTLYPKEEIVGRNCRFLQGKYTDVATVKKLGQAIRDAKPIEVELLNYRKDGSPFFNHFVVLPLFKGSKPTHFIAVQKDVTALRQSSDPREWNSVDVALWLEDVGLGHHAPQFCAKDVKGDTLLNLHRTDLPQLGVVFRAETKKLADAIDDLRLLVGLKAWSATTRRRVKKGKKTGGKSNATSASSADEGLGARVLQRPEVDAAPPQWRAKGQKEEATLDMDARAPRELDVWAKAPDTSVVAVKAHYKGTVELVRVPGNCTVAFLLSAVEKRFDNVRMLARIAADVLGGGGGADGTASEDASETMGGGRDAGTVKLVHLRSDAMLAQALKASDGGTLDVYLRQAPLDATATRIESLDGVSFAALRTDSEGFIVWLNSFAEKLFNLTNADVCVADVSLNHLFTVANKFGDAAAAATDDDEEDSDAKEATSGATLCWSVPVDKTANLSPKEAKKAPKTPAPERVLLSVAPIDKVTDERLVIAVPFTASAEKRLAAVAGSVPKPIPFGQLSDVAESSTATDTKAGAKDDSAADDDDDDADADEAEKPKAKKADKKAEKTKVKKRK
jgi:hypothetical protein